MLGRFVSTRRLSLLALFLFLASLISIRNSRYSKHVPQYDFPTSDRPSDEPKPADEASVERLSPLEVAVPSAETPWFHLSETLQEKTSATNVQGAHSGARSSPTATSPLLPATHNKTTNSQPTVLHYKTKAELQALIKELIPWDRPTDQPHHYPPYADYTNTDYDPNRWEAFEQENGYYLSDRTKQLKDQPVTSPQSYLPYPEYNKETWRKQWKGEHVSCKGAGGKFLNESRDDIIQTYRGLPTGFPSPSVGSAEALGLDEGICFDRYSRYGPYGLGDDQDEIPGWTTPRAKIDWSNVRWGELQNECLLNNMDRYEPDARIEIVLAPRRGLTKEDVQSTVSKGESSGPAYKRRTAVLIRTWEGHSYTQNDFQAIRALITELSLLSGGEYQVFLFVNVKDYNAPIFDNDQVYRDVLKSAVPQEFRDISVLWNEKLCTEWYPVIGDWQVYWHQFMPLQWFSKNHPEFDYVWNWEMDARYIGNHYHFLEQIAAFSRNVPRKHLWEQNQRFYFPEVHGIYQNYIDDTNAIIANATSKGLLTPVWGPQSYLPKQEPLGPDPPRTSDQDNYTWGADEEADLITLQPIWDPTKTGWDFKYKIWNFAEGKSPHFSPDNPLDPSFYDPSFETLPRRVFINTQVRLSKKMLHAMHVENQAGRTMQAEMWPATVALHHGLKAVYAPHPIWLDRKWPAWYLDAVFNADGGKAARWGVDSDSVYNRDREVNFKGWSWYYTSYFPKVLYRRWLGWKAEDGLGNVGGEQWEKEYGRMCLPGMLLHPVKDVEEEQT